jgi:hypothetical protein
MIDFGTWLKQQATITITPGANSWDMAVREVVGGIVFLHQVTRANGSVVPRFDITIDGDGIIQQSQLEPQKIWLPMTHDFLAPHRAQWEADCALTYALCPASVSAGATLSDMTNATAEDIANVAMVNQIRTRFGMGLLG